MDKGQLIVDNGWQIMRLVDVCKVINGGTPKTKIEEYWNGPHFWVTPAEMGKRKMPFVSETKRTLTNIGMQNTSAQLVPPLSVILSTRAPIGHLVLNTVEMAFNQGCRGLVPEDNLEYKFLYYFLLGNVDLLNELGTGATFKELSATKLKCVNIPLPPLPEQKRIVAILDEAFAGISLAVANAKKNLANARELFESYLNNVFTQKGDGWEEKTLSEACIFSQGIQVAVKSQSESLNGNEQIRFLRIVDFTQGNEVPRYIQDPGEKYFVSKGDISIVRYGASTGFICRGLEGVIANNLFKVIPKESSLSNEFLYYFLLSSAFQGEIKKAIGGAAMPAISFSLINDILTLIPSATAQEEIVKTLDMLTIKTKHLETIYQKKLTALNELKQSILKKAFTGQLTNATDKG